MTRIVRIAIMLVGCASLIACAPPVDEMRSAVEDFGFSDVTLGGYAWIGCSKNDTFERKWTGRNQAGRPVNGVVCGGFGKGWTVRIMGRG